MVRAATRRLDRRPDPMSALSRGGPRERGGGPPGLSESGGVRATEYANRLHIQGVSKGASSSRDFPSGTGGIGNAMPDISGIASPGSGGELTARQQ
eukprot:6351123-Alexandrium_andersonii.AAC.1